MIRKTEFLGMVLILILTSAIRLRLAPMPLERDEGEYAYMAQLMLQGVPPYSEAFGMKFPGIYAAYAAILAIFGQTDFGIRVGLLFVNAATILLVYLIARKMSAMQMGAMNRAPTQKDQHAEREIGEKEESRRVIHHAPTQKDQHAEREIGEEEESRRAMNRAPTQNDQPAGREVGEEEECRGVIHHAQGFLPPDNQSPTASPKIGGPIQISGSEIQNPSEDSADQLSVPPSPSLPVPHLPAPPSSALPLSLKLSPLPRLLRTKRRASSPQSPHLPVPQSLTSPLPSPPSLAPWAAAIYAVASLAPSMLGITANAEHFVVLFAMMGALVLVGGRATTQGRPYGRWLLAGITFGLAITMKQQGMFFAVFGFLWLLYRVHCSRDLPITDRPGLSPPSSVLPPQSSVFRSPSFCSSAVPQFPLPVPSPSSPPSSLLRPPSSAQASASAKAPADKTVGKQPAVPPSPSLPVPHLPAPPSTPLILHPSSFILPLFPFLTGLALPLVVTGIWLTEAGVLEPFRFWCFEYARHYGGMWDWQDGLRHFWLKFKPVLLDHLPFFMLGLWGLVAAWKQNRQTFWFVAGLTAAGFLATCPGLIFRPHYFIFILPGLSLSTALGLAGIQNLKFKIQNLKNEGSTKFGARNAENPEPPSAVIHPPSSVLSPQSNVERRTSSAALWAASLLFPLVMQFAAFFTASPEEVSRRLYSPNAFPEMRTVAFWLGERLKIMEGDASGREEGSRGVPSSPGRVAAPAARPSQPRLLWRRMQPRPPRDNSRMVLVLGSEPQIFFYAHGRSASPYLYMYPLLEPQPFAAGMQHDFMDRLEKSPPLYVVHVPRESIPTSWLVYRNSRTELLEWIPRFLDAHYVREKGFPVGEKTDGREIVVYRQTR